MNTPIMPTPRAMVSLSIISLLVVLAAFGATGAVPPAHAQTTATFNAYAGFLITDIPLSGPLAGSVLGVDSYHIRDSTYGSNYDLVIYYAVFKGLDYDIRDPDTYVVMPIGFYTNSPNVAAGMLADFGIPVLPAPGLSVSKTVSKGNHTITADGLPLLPPSSVTFTATPSDDGKTSRMPVTDEELGPITVTFKGVWRSADATTTPDLGPLTGDGLFVQNVGITITGP